ncbi:MAG: DUF1631 family protein [Burkholderiaceae bacterium]
MSDTLADAFMSCTEVIPQESLDKLSERLAHLEDYLPEGGGRPDLDNDSIEMITGVDASNIEVIKQGGSKPSEAMRAWATELQIGSWFGLDHNGKFNSVQLAWRSERGQLYLFVTNGGRCFLIQANWVAAYLQAGLLVPSEDEHSPCAQPATHWPSSTPTRSACSTEPHCLMAASGLLPGQL